MPKFHKSRERRILDRLMVLAKPLEMSRKPTEWLQKRKIYFLKLGYQCKLGVSGYIMSKVKWNLKF